MIRHYPFPSELVRNLSHGSEGHAVDGWTVIRNELTGVWSWGTEHTLVVSGKLNEGEPDTFWAYDYRAASGDGDVEDQFPGETVNLYNVIPVAKYAIDFEPAIENG